VPLVGWLSLVRKPVTEPVSPSRTKRRLPSARAIGLFGLTWLAAVLIACANLPTGGEPGSEPAPGVLPVAPVTVTGQQTLNLYLIIFVIAIIVFVIVEGLLIWITLRYRRKPGDDVLPKQTHGNNPLELLWTIIPAITVTALFAAALITLNDQETVSANPAVTVDVTGFQWQWTFEYKDQGIKLTGAGKEGPVMGLPVNEVVHIRLHSSDVIHSFYVPQALFKKDVVPGRTNEFDWQFNQTGTYAGQCAEFCGLSHADMHFTLQVMDRAGYDAWIAQQQLPPTPGPSQPAPPPGAQTVQVSSVSITAGFNPSTLTVAANQPWTVQLTNADPVVPHNFSIHKGNADGSDWLGQPNADGGQSATYNPPPLAAGDYKFFCSIHPNMVGDLHVQ
jgi:cytochrome c oxidase subunit 2